MPAGFFTLLKSLLYRDLSQREQFSEEALGKVSGVRCQCSAGSNEDWGLNANRIVLVWIPDSPTQSGFRDDFLRRARRPVPPAQRPAPLHRGPSHQRSRVWGKFEIFCPMPYAPCPMLPVDHFPLYSRCRRDKLQRRNRSQYTSRHQPPFPVRFPLPLVWR